MATKHPPIHPKRHEGTRGRRHLAAFALVLAVLTGIAACKSSDADGPTPAEPGQEAVEGSGAQTEGSASATRADLTGPPSSPANVAAGQPGAAGSPADPQQPSGAAPGLPTPPTVGGTPGGQTAPPGLPAHPGANQPPGLPSQPGNSTPPGLPGHPPQAGQNTNPLGLQNHGTAPPSAVGSTTIEVQPGMAQRTASGVAMSQRAGVQIDPSCAGFFPHQPNHTLEVSGSVRVDLHVVHADGNADLTLAIAGPTGTLCDDDSGSGQLPRIQTQLTAGSYHVYVGGFDESVRAGYSMQVGEAAPVRQVSDCDGTESISIGGEFAPIQLAGEVQGAAPCSAALGIDLCPGYVGQAAGRCVEVTEPTMAVFEVTGANFDPILALQAPGGQDSAFNDDGPDGTLSVLEKMLQPGRYALHIGTYGASESGRYTLEIHPPEPLQIELDTTQCASLQPGGTPTIFQGATGLNSSCKTALSFECIGYIDRQMGHCFRIDQPMTITAEVTTAGYDTTLAVVSQDVRLSDDDSGSEWLSRIEERLPAGTYHVFVGSYNQTENGSYTLQVRAAP